MCGYWNLVLNPEVDTHNYLHINNPKARQVVLNLIEEENFIDVWRVMNEDEKGFTWSRKNPIKKTSTVRLFFNYRKLLWVCY